jgi:hypothetical protein
MWVRTSRSSPRANAFGPTAVLTIEVEIVKAALRADCRSFGPLLLAALLAAFGAACGGAPDSISLEDGVSSVSEGNAVGDPMGDAMAPEKTAACAVVAEGCPCDQEGETVQCQTAKVRTGDYTTCAPGKRACKDGTWGPCLGKTLYRSATR